MQMVIMAMVAMVDRVEDQLETEAAAALGKVVLGLVAGQLETLAAALE